MKPPEGEIIKLNGLYNVVNQPNALELSWQWDEPDAKETKVKVEFNPTCTNTEATMARGEFSGGESKDGHEQG